MESLRFLDNSGIIPGQVNIVFVINYIPVKPKSPSNLSGLVLLYSPVQSIRCDIPIDKTMKIIK